MDDMEDDDDDDDCDDDELGEEVEEQSPSTANKQEEEEKKHASPQGRIYLPAMRVAMLLRSVDRSGTMKKIEKKTRRTTK